MDREPRAIGFYPSDKEDIIALFKYFEKRVDKIGLKANYLISPHAGYIYSGYAAFYGYYNVKEYLKDTIVILGPDHYNYGFKFNLTTYENFITPLGKVKVNEEINEFLSKFDVFEFNDMAHEYEHSIEVQLPFLQYFLRKFEIVPITISTHRIEDLKRASEVLRKLDEKYDVFYVISSDFTHYGLNYGYYPFGLDDYEVLKEKVKKLDFEAINYIINGRALDFYNFVINKNPTICGFAGITTILLKSRVKGKMLIYYTSNDVAEKQDFFVSYSSIALWNL